MRPSTLMIVVVCMLVGRTPATRAAERTPQASAPPRTEDEPSTRLRLSEAIVRTSTIRF